MKIFARNLTELRNQRGYTQQQLAEIADLGPMTISKYERAAHWPRPETVAKLAKALNVPEARLWLDHTLIDPEIALAVLRAVVDSSKK